MDVLKAQDPARIGAHTLLARLGAGGMGQVYLGRSPGGRLVAIKVIRDEIVDHPEALARFRREVETVRVVRSAYTANLIDASLETAPYWLATEYVPGPTLSRAVAARGPLPVETCRGLLAALAEGLAAVHAQRVTHRDLKPQNVILAAQGPQLIDFGIARSAAQTALTEAGFAPGTPGYTAPEVLLRNEAGPAADVFALGATLAYAATGRPPFGSGEPAGVSYRAVHEPMDLEGVEPGLAALIGSCAAKEPADRPGLGELIAWCGVRSALVEDVFYAGLAELAEAVPSTPAASFRTPAASPGPSAAPAYPPLGPHDLPTAPPAYGYGYTPTQTVRSAAAGRRKPWLIAGATGLAVGLGAVAAFTLLPGMKDEGDKGADGASGAGATSAAPTTAGGDESKLQPPAYVEETNPSRDFWTADPQSQHGEGTCNLPMEERSEQFLGSVAEEGSDAPYTSGKGRIGLRLKAAATTPYYVAVAVKSPHAIDADTGKPFEGGLQANVDLGYTSKPVALGTEWVYLTYPDDFRQIVRGKKAGDAIPVANDPGDWTVLFLHVQAPQKYVTIDCRGFVSK
ncbi:hypothetical protein QFZ56_003684 [Streptomyces achromogenes]|uniref:Protein kinase domain-containing protein n=1 Tax=Streptomyces achromogenes TaxID=67255 RepID=A0ABU0Q2Y6_STRAH|nr:serine/threonine-protein kinase [Streptomyces achromogenes]MDQ0684721.1 hypothetical protein [Streptomyces achromogenes]